MYTGLIPHAIGIKGRSLPASIDLAAETGFQSVTFDIKEAAALADEHGVEHVRGLFAARDILPAGWSVPVAWRDDTKRYAQLKDLPKLAALGVALGCPRALSGVPFGSNDMPYDEHFAWTVERLRPVAETLWAENRVRMLTLPRRNHQRQAPKGLRRLLNGARQVAETVNGQLAEQFRIEVNHAQSFWGLTARLLTELTAHALRVHLNRLLGNPEYLQIKALAFPN